MSPVWNMIYKIWDIFFEVIQIEVQCTKNYFKISSGNIIEKKPQKPRPKLKKYILNLSREYFVSPQSNASGRFLQTSINFVEQQLKFFHFESSIIS